MFLLEVVTSGDPLHLLAHVSDMYTLDTYIKPCTLHALQYLFLTLHKIHNTAYTLYTKSHHHLTLYKRALSSQHKHQFSDSFTLYVHSYFESILAVLELQGRKSGRGLEEETSIIYHKPQLSSLTNKFL
ncbi:hypothetical protein Pfo_027307 [Paulownia fortunei]|nr:hypothetical protein Pfo_027307 [Paulownia fortunei]